MKQSAEVKDALVRFIEAIGKGDITMIERMLSNEPGLRVIGTDPREWWSGHAEVVRIFGTQLKELGQMSITTSDQEGYEEGPAGWGAAKFSADIDGTQIDARISIVFHQEGGEWKLVQSHASIGAVNEEELGKELTTE